VDVTRIRLDLHVVLVNKLHDDDVDDVDDDTSDKVDVVDLLRVVANLIAKCVILPFDGSFLGGTPTGIIEIRCMSFVLVLCLLLLLLLLLELFLLVQTGRSIFG
jgi:hypothetical protein